MGADQRRVPASALQLRDPTQRLAAYRVTPHTARYFRARFLGSGRLSFLSIRSVLLRMWESYCYLFRTASSRSTPFESRITETPARNRNFYC